MFTNAVPSRQLSTWLAAALTPVLLQLTAGTGWPVVLGMSLVGCLLTLVVWKWGKRPACSALLLLQYLYIIVFTAQLLPNAAQCWPGDNYPAVPLILLGLAAWSVSKGAAASARVGCVLFWTMLIIYGSVLATGITQLRDPLCIPSRISIDWRGAILLLLPCGAICLRSEKRKWDIRLVMPAVLLTVGSIVVADVLSCQRATELADPFYEMIQSMNILGIAQQFDAVISAGMTLGWFSLLCTILSLSGACTEFVSPTWGRRGAMAAAGFIALGMLCNLHISWEILLILGAVFWVAIPVLTQGLVRRKIL